MKIVLDIWPGEDSIESDKFEEWEHTVIYSNLDVSISNRSNVIAELSDLIKTFRKNYNLSEDDFIARIYDVTDRFDAYSEITLSEYQIEQFKEIRDSKESKLSEDEKFFHCWWSVYQEDSLTESMTSSNIETSIEFSDGGNCAIDRNNFEDEIIRDLESLKKKLMKTMTNFVL